MEISLKHYKGSNIEKGFRETPSLEQLDLFTINKIEKSLVDNFNQGKFSKEIFERELQKIDIVKAGKLSQNGKLRPVHIIDKNGKHTVVWKAPEDIAGLHNEGHKKVKEVGKGDTVTYNGETHTVHSISDKHGYWTLVDKNGKKHDKSPAKLEAIHTPKDEGNEVKESKVEKVELNKDTTLEEAERLIKTAPIGSIVSWYGKSYEKRKPNVWYSMTSGSVSIKNDDEFYHGYGTNFKPNLTLTIQEKEYKEPKKSEQGDLLSPGDFFRRSTREVADMLNKNSSSYKHSFKEATIAKFGNRALLEKFWDEAVVNTKRRFPYQEWKYIQPIVIEEFFPPIYELYKNGKIKL